MACRTRRNRARNPVPGRGTRSVLPVRQSPAHTEAKDDRKSADVYYMIGLFVTLSALVGSAACWVKIIVPFVHSLDVIEELTEMREDLARPGNAVVTKGSVPAREAELTQYR